MLKKGKTCDEDGVGIGKKAVRVALAHQSSKRIPRGETWLGRGVFRDLGWEDTLEAHLQLCHEACMDMIFLPVGAPGSNGPSLNYRYFGLDDVSHILVTNENIFVGVVFDGPFQRLSQKIGLPALLASLIRRDSITSALREEALQVEEIVSDCLELKPDAVVIADDIAYSRTTFANPRDLRQILFPHYRIIIQHIQAANVQALFHSDGNLSVVIPDLISCGFTGLSACEPRYQNLLALKQGYGEHLTFVTGITAECLEAGSLEAACREQFTRIVTAMRKEGGFILCSSCGLSSKRHLDNLKRLYQWADEAWNFPGSSGIE